MNLSVCVCVCVSSLERLFCSFVQPLRAYFNGLLTLSWLRSDLRKTGPDVYLWFFIFLGGFMSFCWVCVEMVILLYFFNSMEET